MKILARLNNIKITESNGRIFLVTYGKNLPVTEIGGYEKGMQVIITPNYIVLGKKALFVVDLKKLLNGETENFEKAFFVDEDNVWTVHGLYLCDGYNVDDTDYIKIDAENNEGHFLFEMNLETEVYDKILEMNIKS